MDPEDPTQQPANPGAPALHFAVGPVADAADVMICDDFDIEVGEPPD